MFIVVILYLFLNQRVAFWVTLGIPVSFLATLAILWMIGGTINMISLFGMIMALGVIVDDAIVVAEDTLSLYQSGKRLSMRQWGLRPHACTGGFVEPDYDRRLLTTPHSRRRHRLDSARYSDHRDLRHCSVTDRMLFHSPGHLYKASAVGQRHDEGKIRQALDRGFINFRENLFKPFVEIILESASAHPRYCPHSLCSINWLNLWGTRQVHVFSID